ncbi:MAG TPA: universal stress protein [Candidatus Paceibacterota bacterium]|nr:universal stress protein [Verrucomicrobiota bacterium]HRY46996.1 universal stress protein [Candidatus Paceibacterota bacterium]HRZ99104.1 universal stress protein [Candidatus Paceibacterota bacterium]
MNTIPSPEAEQNPQSVPPAAVEPETPKSAFAPIRLGKILVPVDFSDPSRKALKYATAFAAHFRASVILLHVVEFNFVGSDFGLVELSQVETDMRESAAQRIGEWLKEEVGAGLSAESMVRCGRPYLEIIDTAKESEVDMILIAAHGHSSLAHILLGSTVERVVRHAPCPVLVLRPVQHEFV